MLNRVLAVYKKGSWDTYSQSPDEALRNKMVTVQDAQRLKLSNDTQQRNLDAVLEFLTQEHIPFDARYRADLDDSEHAPDFSNYDLVITIGGDGTFLEASHHVHDTPLLGVNSDPNPGGSIGYFSVATAKTLPALLRQFDTLPRTTLSRMAVFRNDERLRELVLNDAIFSGETIASACRYKLNGEDKKRVGNGLLVCTPGGSTAFMVNAGGMVMPLDEGVLQYREFFPINRRAHSGFDTEIVLYSLTRKGYLFLDGEHITYPVTLYDTIRFSIGEPLTVIGDLNQKRPWYQRGDFGKALYQSRRVFHGAVAQLEDAIHKN